jgi:hydrogenase maturation protease
VTPGVLVVGYGNALRADDGIGPLVAERLAGDPRLAGATVLARHQLTPDLALDVSGASLVVFLDAALGPAPGTFVIEPPVPAAGPAATWSHHLDPGSLVALAAELYGRAPEAVVVRVGVGSLEAGEGLSPAVAAAVPGIADEVAGLVAARLRGAVDERGAAPRA